MDHKQTKHILIFLPFLLTLFMFSGRAMAVAVPENKAVEIDADPGDTMNEDHSVTDDGVTTWNPPLNGTGMYWWQIPNDEDIFPYSGASMYRVKCDEPAVYDPDAGNDRTEQKIFESWDINDTYRYFSFAFNVSEYTSSPYADFHSICQWWQESPMSPPLAFFWYPTGYCHLVQKNNYDDWHALYTFTLEKGLWYHFLLCFDFGLNGTGTINLKKMNLATGLWEEQTLTFREGSGESNDSITLGWDYNPDTGIPVDKTNFTWKIGTYRAPSPNKSWVQYDNIRYASSLNHATKNCLTGYHRNYLNLSFEETSGATAYDSTEYENDGTCSNTTRTTGGINGGRCLGFNGTNASVSVPTTDPYKFDEAGNYLTVGCWFGSAYSQSGKPLISLNAAAVGYQLKWVNNNTLSFSVGYYDGTTSVATATLPYSLTDNVWRHVTGTYNRWSPDGKRIKLYLNGVKIAEADGADKPIRKGTWLYIGKAMTYFKGYIDEVTAYNFAMTEDEVEALYLSY